MKKKDINNLLEPDHAVENYLDTLLQESTESQVGTTAVKTEARVVLLPEFDLSPLAEPEKETQIPLDAAKAETVQQMSDLPAMDPVIDTGIGQNQTSKNSNDYQFPIQCLMFRVGHTDLSIPLIDLGSVLPWVENMTQLPQAPEWFLGLLKHRDKNVKVADSATLLNIKTDPEVDVCSHILVLDNEHWAINCDRIGEVILLNQEDIQWSRGHSDNNLSLGTIRESLAQLLDPSRIIKRLNKRESIAGLE